MLCPRERSYIAHRTLILACPGFQRFGPNPGQLETVETINEANRLKKFIIELMLISTSLRVRLHIAPVNNLFISQTGSCSLYAEGNSSPDQTWVWVPCWQCLKVAGQASQPAELRMHAHRCQIDMVTNW